MPKESLSIENSKIVELSRIVARILLHRIGLDPEKSPKSLDYVAAGIKPRIARNLHKSRLDKIRIGVSTGYKKHKAAGSNANLDAGRAIADFGCIAYDLPLKANAGLAGEYNNLVIFYESLFAQCSEADYIARIIANKGRTRRKKNNAVQKESGQPPISAAPAAPDPQLQKVDIEPDAD